MSLGGVAIYLHPILFDKCIKKAYTACINTFYVTNYSQAYCY